MQGDKLASGARSAQFSVAPNIKFDEDEMRRDLPRLTQEEFCDKYMIARLEYNQIKFGGDERVNTFVKDMQQRTEMIERELEADAKQEASLRQECFLDPFVPLGLSGKVIVERDIPLKRASPIIQPPKRQQAKTLLPTTGRIIKAKVFQDDGVNASDRFIGVRILFGQMSGSAICFKGYPTWIELDLSEIMCIVRKEDAEVLEEPLEPMV